MNLKFLNLRIDLKNLMYLLNQKNQKYQHLLLS
jgi:hypothetical protein